MVRPLTLRGSSRLAAKLMTTAGQLAGGDNSDFTMALESDEERESIKKIKREKERQEARRAQTVENARG